MLNECVNFGPVPAAEGADRTAVFPLALQEHLHTGLYLFLFFCVCVHVKDVYAEAFMTFLRFCREKWGGKKKEMLHSWFPLQNQWTELAELTDVQFLIVCEC